MTRLQTLEPAMAPVVGAVESIVEVLSSRHPEGQGFSFKVRTSGRVYRLDSAREPHLPRFWCFRIVRCATAGMVDVTERPWYGGDRMTREELPAAVAAIRAALDEWLALPQHSELRAWILEDCLPEGPQPTLASAATRRVPTR